MCGILAAVSPTHNRLRLKSSLLTMKHRGPDFQDDILLDNIYLGHNRLSILDLNPRSNQPFSSGKYHMIYNGEVYNYIELILEHNLQVSTKSDTEVVAHAIDNWGIEKTLEQIRGMFAMSIFDNHESKLYLVRDPAGIKPLYCAKTNEGWIFASQYDQIFKHSWFSKTKKVNIHALSEYFQLGYIPAPNALYMNSWMIEPGFYYVIDMNFNLLLV